MPTTKKALLVGRPASVTQLFDAFKKTDVFQSNGIEKDKSIQVKHQDGFTTMIGKFNELPDDSTTFGEHCSKVHVFAMVFDLSDPTTSTELLATDEHELSVIKEFIKATKQAKTHSKFLFILTNPTNTNADISDKLNVFAANTSVDGVFSADSDDPAQIATLLEDLQTIISVSQAIFSTTVAEMDKENLLRKSLETLQKTIINLPEKVQQDIAAEAEVMVNGLKGDDPALSITTFQHNCDALLKKHAPLTIADKILKAVAAVAISATVTVIAAAIGFGIGFAAGLWTGPGAFISGFLAGTAAASTAVATSGLVGFGFGAFSAYHFFKPQPTLASDVAHSIIEDVVAEAKRETTITV